MLKHYLRVAARQLGRHRGYAFVNVLGLALGMACCLLLFTLLRHEWRFDRFHEQRDRIHRVLIAETLADGETMYHDKIPPALAEAVEPAFPGVASVTRFVMGQRFFERDGRLVPHRLAMADSTFFEIFSFPLLAGDPGTVLDDPQQVVLSTAVAEQHFGRADAGVLGETVTVEVGAERRPFTVAGVAAPFPETSSLSFDVLMSFEQYPEIYVGGNDWGGRNSLYLLLRPEQDPAALEAALPPFTAEQFAERIADRRAHGALAAAEDAFRLELQPLENIHFEPEKGVSYAATPHDPLYSYILGGLALVILAIACINFTTLAIGRSTSRAREVGVRKALGAGQGQIRRQFWGEALLTTALALPLAVVLVAVALPFFNDATEQAFGLGDFADLGVGAVAVALLAGVGLVAGSYPAAVLARFQPSAVLRGQAQVRGRTRLTRALVVVQYAVSIALIAGTLVMYRQLDFLLDRDLGFRGEQVVVVQTPGLKWEDRLRVPNLFREATEGRDGILDVERAAYSFSRSYDTYGWEDASGRRVWAHNFGVDYGTLDLLGMELVAGRWFSPAHPTDSTRSVVVNETFAREHGLAPPGREGEAVGHVLTGLDDGFFGANPTIIGVVRDFNFLSLHSEVEPAMLNMHPDYYMGTQAILAKVAAASTPAALARMEAVWTELFPERAFEYAFLDEDMAAQYQDERRWRGILTGAALLAVLIASLGLFGLATLAVARRTKEIGVRKVLGASVAGLAGLVARDFVVLVGVAALVAAPAAWWALGRWLEGFAYRIELGPWAFVAAGVLALGVALGTVGVQAVRAATADPVRALRSE